MRRLTSIKRSKSPPPAFYSMDNPVFEDTATSTATSTTSAAAAATTTTNVSATMHPVHVRYFLSAWCISGLCCMLLQDALFKYLCCILRYFHKKN